MRTDINLRGKKSPAKDVGAGDPKVIAEYLACLGDDLRSGRKSGWETVSTEATKDKPKAILPMNWNRMNVLSREELCLGAAIAVKCARQQWEKLEPWLQFLLAESSLVRSCGRVALRGDQPVAWERHSMP